MAIRGRYSPKGVTDISSGTNLTVTSPITLTGDDIGLDQSTVEIVASGNDAGDDDNWQFIVSGNNLLTQVRISGAWVTVHTRERPV